jgi:hypothetical protein
VPTPLFPLDTSPGSPVAQTSPRPEEQEQCDNVPVDPHIRLLTEQSDKVLKGSGLADQADAAVSVKPAGAQKTALLYTRFAKRRANQISG